MSGGSVTISGSALRQRYTGDSTPAGVRSGRGTYVFPNSFYEYTGDWRDNRRHGQGVMTLGAGAGAGSAPAAYYKGSWVDDEMEGLGERRYASGRVYVGEFRAGEPEGRGKLVMEDGVSEYEGAFSAGMRHGTPPAPLTPARPRPQRRRRGPPPRAGLTVPPRRARAQVPAGRTTPRPARATRASSGRTGCSAPGA